MAWFVTTSSASLYLSASAPSVQDLSCPDPIGAIHETGRVSSWPHQRGPTSRVRHSHLRRQPLTP